MCSQNSHKDFSSEIIKYRPAVYNKKSKEKYVFFYVLDPESVKNGCSKLKRIRTKFNRYATAKERDEAAMRYVRDINQRLESGWNPLIQDSTNKSWCSLQELFEKYRRYLEKCKKENVLKMKTYVDYSSRLRTFEEFTKQHSLNYIYQLNKPYAESFLDYIYIDRDNAPRTRNNYLIWLSSFCTWLVDGGFLESNPCAKIKSLRNGEKKQKDGRRGIYGEIGRTPYEDRQELPSCMSIRLLYFMSTYRDESAEAIRHKSEESDCILQ